LGRTVEKYSKTKRKERITKSSTSLNPAYRNWVGLLKNTLRPTQRKESQKSSTSLIPAFIGRNWVGLLKFLRPNTKKGITKEQHITQSLLS
jgi:hypothetical protein